MSRRKQILITVFGGWFGLHKYMSGKIGIGILYTFTLGLFYVGWIYDCIKVISNKNSINENVDTLICWQNLVCNMNEDNLLLNKKQLILYSNMYIENNIRILNDSIQLVDTTTTPEVFFNRLDMIIDCYNNLADLDKYFNTNTNAEQKLAEIDEITLTHNFIQRYWYKTVSDAEKLKTEKGKENRKLKAKNDLLSYKEKIDESNLKYLEQLI